jgi:hypothetical protein
MARDCNDLNPKEVKELFNQYLESNPIQVRVPYLGKRGEALWFDNESGRKGLMSHYIDQFDDGVREGQRRGGDGIDTKNKYLQYLTVAEPYGIPNFPPLTRTAILENNYRGFLLNPDWLFYQGDNYSIYYVVKWGAIDSDRNMIVGLRGRHYDTGFGNDSYELFSSPNLLDITTLICNPKPKNSFMNWTENPLEGV